MPYFLATRGEAGSPAFCNVWRSTACYKGFGEIAVIAGRLRERIKSTLSGRYGGALQWEEAQEVCLATGMILKEAEPAPNPM